MTNGRRWLALDADMFGKPFTLDLHHKFGWAGVATWVAFLCACKRSQTPGTVRFLNEADARAQLGILGWELVDDKGQQWTLEDFWLFTGRKKQTKRTRRGREMNVTSTHWERWQKMHTMQRHAEQMRRSRAQKRDKSVRGPSHAQVTRVTSNRDIDKDISPYPLSAPADADTTSAERRRNGSKKTEEPLVQWVRTCVPGTGLGAARQAVDRLRAAGVGDVVIEEAAGYAAQHGAETARYIEQVARDWMAQRDPTWSPGP